MSVALLVSAVFPLAILAYAVLAVVSYTGWSMDSAGLALRSTALLRLPLRLAWGEILRIQTAGWGGGWAALKLDGRYLFQRHVTVIRRGGITSRIRFTPRDIDVFEAALRARLAGDPQWERTQVGWERRAM